MLNPDDFPPGYGLIAPSTTYTSTGIPTADYATSKNRFDLIAEILKECPFDASYIRRRALEIGLSLCDDSHGPDADTELFNMRDYVEWLNLKITEAALKKE